MTYLCEYPNDLVGMLALESDGTSLTGCRFQSARRIGCGADGPLELERCDDLPVFSQARTWLDRYFAGTRPDPRELLLAEAATEFQARVREALLSIPYGQTTTYGHIARYVAAQTGRRTSARAVGGAVGRNPLGIVVPCHRVVGADGSLVGFAGSLEAKVRLLAHEGADVARLRRKTP